MRVLLAVLLCVALGVGALAQTWAPPLPAPFPVPNWSVPPVPPQLAWVIVGGMAVWGLIEYVYIVLDGEEQARETTTHRDTQAGAEAVTGPEEIVEWSISGRWWGDFAWHGTLAGPAVGQFDLPARLVEARYRERLGMMPGNTDPITWLENWWMWEQNFERMGRDFDQVWFYAPGVHDPRALNLSAVSQGIYFVPYYGREVLDATGFYAGYLRDMSALALFDTRLLPWDGEGPDLPLHVRNYADAVATGQPWSDTVRVADVGLWIGEHHSYFTAGGVVADQPLARVRYHGIHEWASLYRDRAANWATATEFPQVWVGSHVDQSAREHARWGSMTGGWERGTGGMMFERLRLEEGFWPALGAGVATGTYYILGAGGLQHAQQRHVAYPVLGFHVVFVPFSVSHQLDWGSYMCPPAPAECVRGWISPAYMQIQAVVPVVVRIELVDLVGYVVDVDGVEVVIGIDAQYQVTSIISAAGVAYVELLLPAAAQDGEGRVRTEYDLWAGIVPFEAGSNIVDVARLYEAWWRGVWLDRAFGIRAPAVEWPAAGTLALPWDAPGARDEGVSARQRDGALVLWLVNPVQALREAFVPSVGLGERFEALRAVVVTRFPFGLAVSLRLPSGVGAGVLAIPAVTFGGLQITPDNQWLLGVGEGVRTSVGVLLSLVVIMWIRGKLTPRTVM